MIGSKKGKFSEVMSFFPVLMIIIFVMAVFIIGSYSASKIRSSGNQNPYFNSIAENSILFKAINVSGNTTLVSEEIIREYAKHNILDLSNKGIADSLLYSKSDFNIPDNLINAIKKLMLDDTNNPLLCVYLGKASYIDRLGLTSKAEDSADWRGINLIKKDGVVSVADPIPQTQRLVLNLGDKKMWIVYYYGACQNG